MNIVSQWVISASRRTDIPAFYMPWFMDRIQKGHFEVVNPYNRQTTIIPVDPKRVHTIVFWSKDFGPFLQGRYGQRLEAMGFHLFFNFTVNSENQRLEPHVPPLPERLRQLKALTRQFDARAVHWRFDPICHYRENGNLKHNLEAFHNIAMYAGEAGVSRCITSFLDIYPKVNKRTAKLSRFQFVDPPMDRKVEILMGMEADLKRYSMGLYTCCEKAVMDALPDNTMIRSSACIPNDHLMKLFGGTLSRQRDRGQRIRAGCGCQVSKDIGAYALHPCFHNCLFCYANPHEPEHSQQHPAVCP